MRVGVYNRHWSTMGGGERFAAGIAEVLSAVHTVDLVGHTPIDVPKLGEWLQLDLNDVGTSIIGNAPGAMTQASRAYDLFVNASYLSHDVSEAPASMLVVHFPARLPRAIAPRRLAGAALRSALGLVSNVQTTAPELWGEGFHQAVSTRRHAVAWTNGEGRLEMRPKGDDGHIDLTFGCLRPAEAGPAELEIEVDGSVVRSVVLEHVHEGSSRPVHVRVPAAARADGEPNQVVIRSTTFVPADAMGTDDERTLGVPLLISNRTALAGVVGPITPLRFLRSYDTVVANSRFTARFIDRWWHRSSELLYPPVTVFEAGPKAPIVLSVARFFHADRGHSKKQLEMVRAFGEIHRTSERARAEGWELHLVGGCAPRDQPYLDEVRASAEGLPVVFHIGTSGGELQDLYRRASVFWSATGLGEDEEELPVRFEHFGISTVEAMSAGLVPIVLDRAGGLEIVEPDRSGLHFSSERGLVEQTVRVIEDDTLRQRLSEGARVRSADFSPTAFARSLDHVVTLTLDRSRRR